MANANLKTKLQHLELSYIKLYRKVTHNIVNSNLVGAAVDTIAERKGVRTDKLHEYRFLYLLLFGDINAQCGPQRQ